MKSIAFRLALLVFLGYSCRKSFQSSVVEVNGNDFWCHFTQEDSASILDLHVFNTSTYRRTDSSLIFLSTVGKDTFFWIEMKTQSLTDGLIYTLTDTASESSTAQIRGRVYISKRYWNQPYDSATFGPNYHNLTIGYNNGTEKKYNYPDQDSAISFHYQGNIICQSCGAWRINDTTGKPEFFYSPEPVNLSGLIFATKSKQ